MVESTSIEKKSLEAHVGLCAERYTVLGERSVALQEKLDIISSKVEKLESHIVFIREHIAGSKSYSNTQTTNSAQLITIGTTIVGVLIAGIISLVINLVIK